MSSLQDASNDVDPSEVIFEEQSESDGTGPPLQVSAAEQMPVGPANSTLLLRLQDLFDRSRPAIIGLVLLGAISASIAFAWQSRLGGDDSDLNEALANLGSPDEGSAPTADQARAVGDFESDSASTVTTAKQSGTLQVAGSSQRRTIESETDDDAESVTSTSSRRRTTAVADSAPTTPSTRVSITTIATVATTVTTVTSTSPTTPTSATTGRPSTTRRPSTTTTERPTTTTTEAPTTTATEPPTTAPAFNPTGQFTLVNAGSGRCASGQRDIIDQQTCGTDSSQTFRFESTGGDIRIVEKQTGLVFDVESGSYSSGASIIPYPWHGGSNQRWTVEPVGSYYQIVSVKSGLCISVPSGSGRRLRQNHCDGGTDQLWALS